LINSINHIKPIVSTTYGVLEVFGHVQVGVSPGTRKTGSTVMRAPLMHGLPIMKARRRRCGRVLFTFIQAAPEK
jgi:hypothetical protein